MRQARDNNQWTVGIPFATLAQIIAFTIKGGINEESS